jgi:FkbM family methyltransferase
MIDNIKFENNGCRFNFTWIGETGRKFVVYIIDGYTKLKFYKVVFDAFNNCGYFVETPNNVKHKIYSIYDEKEEELLFTINNNYGWIDLDKIDTGNYFKDIGKNYLTHNMLAVPVYEIYVSNIYDHNQCKIEKGDVIFDIGANIGMFTYYALNKNCGKSYCFEPNQELANVIKNKNISNIVVENVAIGKEEGFQNFFISEGGISSCLEKDNNQILNDDGLYHRGNDIFKKVEVKTINIMNYIKDNKIEKIDYFKSDCEGGEYDLIETIDFDYLKNNIKKLMIEYHYLYNPYFKEKYVQMINKLVECGFKYHNNSDDTMVNDGVLFFWKES